MATGSDSRPLTLDIGTGSGLLSMLAARMEVRGVVTCERDTPMANAAMKIIEARSLLDG